MEFKNIKQVNRLKKTFDLVNRTSTSYAIRLEQLCYKYFLYKEHLQESLVRFSVSWGT